MGSGRATTLREICRQAVEPLERYLRDGRHYLVVVGALHLVGRDNVIDMLKARGHAAVRLQ